MNGLEYLFGAVSGLWHVLVSEPVPFAARMALAALLATGGLYKLRHPLVAATAAVNSRVARRPSRPVGYVLGGVETLTAGLLLAPWPALGPLATFLWSACAHIPFRRTLFWTS